VALGDIKAKKLLFDVKRVNQVSLHIKVLILSDEDKYFSSSSRYGRPARRCCWI